jgi:L-ribulose-5-phosphate 3-epimerase
VKILLHTMATPHLDLPGAIRQARALGLDGVEVVRQEGYRCALSPSSSLTEARTIGALAERLGAPVRALSPYVKAFNDADDSARAAAVAEMTAAIAQAQALGAPRLRLLAGEEETPSLWEASLERLVESLRGLAVLAARAGISLDIENHPGTMADDAARTMRIWRAVDHPALGVIYDPGNLAREGKEAFPASLIAQSDAIRHVHVKDYVFAPDLPNGRRAVPPGEGMLGWGAIIAALSHLGYEGDLTLEYETRWVPDELPPPEIGLAIGRDFLRRCLEGDPGR